MRYLILALLMNGCATPIVQTVGTIHGPVIEHIDTDDSPCGERHYSAGCYQSIDGVHHVWYSAIGGAKDHEYAHVSGMRHTDYQRTGSRLCAVVTRGAEGYATGEVICTGSGK